MPFIKRDDVEVEDLDWGPLGWVVTPTTVPDADLTVLDVTIQPGQGHGFHRHPRQEEVIHVLSGQVEQWVEEEHHVLEAGDTAYVPADTIHASFVDADATEPGRLVVFLTPSVTDEGYEAVDAPDEEPWSSLRS